MSNPASAEVPRAYSYMRFSTLEQGKGDSLSRQAAMAREWSERKGVPLDTELNLTDKGVSAYHGANAETGALGTFLDVVKAGLIPRGSWLLVENLDRISRQVVRKAARTIEDLVDAGITVVDLSDGAREYSAEALDSEPMLFLTMAIGFMRSNEESAKKGGRVAAAYGSKRKSFAGEQALDKPYTRRLPAWMRWDNHEKAYAVIDERGALVREMFELTDAGWGQHRIAREFNARGLETWGAGGWKAMYWHRSYIRKILSNRAVIGVFTPHLSTKDPVTSRRTRTALPTIDHRLPAVVDRELFERVSNRLKTPAARGRNSSGEPRSIFSGVLKCQYCDGTVTRVSKGNHVYLVCAAANARGGTCKYETVPYQQAEDSFCIAIEAIVHDAPRGRDTNDLEEAIRDAEYFASERREELGELLELVIGDRSRAARERLKTAEAHMAKANEKVAEANKRLDSLTSVSVMRKLDALRDVLGQSPLNIAEANRALKNAMRKMVIYPTRGAIEIHWHHTDEPQQTGGLVTNRGPFGPIRKQAE